MCKKVWISIVVFLANILLYADPQHPIKGRTEDANKWVDSVYNTLSEDEKIGQLFIATANLRKGQEGLAQLENLIKEHKIGAIAFLNSSPVAQAKLTNLYQSISPVPLFIGMSLTSDNDSILKAPSPLTLAASDEKTVLEKGKATAYQLKRLGVQINFTPFEQIILLEEAGAKSPLTTRNGAYLKGLKEGKVIPNAKFFPSLEKDNDFTLKTSEGFRDSTKAIPVGQNSTEAINSSSTGFLADDVKEFLRKEYSLQGIVFLNDLTSKGLNNAVKSDELNLKSLFSENEVLLIPDNIDKAIKKLKSAVKSKEIKSADLEKAVKKILLAKFLTGLNNVSPVSTETIYSDLNSGRIHLANSNLYRKTITLVENKNNLIPFRALDSLSFASVSIGLDHKNEFQSMLSNYSYFENYAILNKYSSDTVFNNILTKVSKKKVVVVSLHGLTATEGNSYGLSPNTLTFLEKLKANANVIIVAFGNPLCFNLIGDNATLLTAYEDNGYSRQLVPQVLFGAMKAEGSLPIPISAKFKSGWSIKTEEVGRLKYNVPESVGVDSYTLNNIDKIAEEAVKTLSTPGCQVLVAKSGTVIFQKSYGFITYDSIQPVTDETIFDIASVTKVIATVQVLMFLEERGLLDLNKKLSDYLPELKNTNKANMVIRDVLVHQAGLTPFIPHWAKTVSYGGFDKNYYSTEKSDKYPIEVAKGMYAIESLPDSVWKWSVKSELQRKKKKQVNFEYKYSDVGYLFLLRIAEKLLNQPIEEFLQQNIYSPLGASTLTYLPLRQFPEGIIAPTEEDKSFRRQVLRGYVHDQGAAMMGGVAGHAGLFSTAADLAKVLQMNLNNGVYGGERYLANTTLSKFTQRQIANNRRGLGWDKPELVNDGQTSSYASTKTYGHTGFTGTCVWVDPDKEIVYVFLSNRIYPNAGNNNLLKVGIRSRIQDEIYKAIINYNNGNRPQ